MSIGANISVIAFGAILSFATHVHTPHFNVPAVGAILIAVGVVGLVMQLAALARQREADVVVELAHVAPPVYTGPEQVVRRVGDHSTDEALVPVSSLTGRPVRFRHRRRLR
jgi:hypothetical protein